MLWTLFSILDTFDSEVIPASSHGGSLRLRETMHISLTHDYFLRVMIYIVVLSWSHVCLSEVFTKSREALFAIDAGCRWGYEAAVVFRTQGCYYCTGGCHNNDPKCCGVMLGKLTLYIFRHDAQNKLF